MKYRAVVFDLFGTLVDDALPGIYPLMAQTLGLPLAEFHEGWKKLYPDRTMGQKSFAECIRAMGFSGPCVDEAATIRTGEVIRSLNAVKQETLAVLERLTAASVRLGLLSNASVEVPQFWPASPLAPFFPDPVFSCSVGLMKPQPDIYRLTCARLGLKPSDCVFVGDGGDDEIVGASAVGMPAVQVENGRPIAPGARFVISCLADLSARLGLELARPS